MIAELSRRMLYRLMHKRAERHAGCRIDVKRLVRDHEYANAIRALAQFTLDEELRTLGAIVDSEASAKAAATAVAAAHAKSATRGAMVLPFRRQSTV